MSKLLRAEDDRRWIFYCPGCEEHHGPNDSWAFNGDAERPTFNPSILVQGTSGGYGTDEPLRDTRCHIFVRDGQIQYLSDCTHALAGQTVPMEDM